MNGLVMFGLGVTGIYGMAAYKRTIMSYIGRLCINMIYWYSYAEIYIRNTLFNYSLIVDKPETDTKCIIYYLKNGNIIKIDEEPNQNQCIPFSEDMNVLIYTTPTLDVTVVDKSQLLFDLSKIKSDIEFINLTVTFENDPKQYSISLRNETSNFYVIGNHINKYIIWMMILNQHNVYRYGYNYTIQIIDHNVSISNAYNQDMNIVIQKEGFYVKQTECEITDLVCETTKSIDK